MLICPLCSAPLSAVDNGAACPANHRFDRARQGYLNLLPVQHKNSRDPGDNQAMVEARRHFLDAGHGVTCTHLAGRLISELLRGDAERFDAFAKLPHYPFPGGRSLRIPFTAMGAAYYSLRDRLGV